MSPVTRRSTALGFLPLTPAVFHVLLALVDDDRHGYGIAKEVATRTQGAMRMGAGTLYGTLTRLSESGLVEECPDRGRPQTLRKRRYFRITPLGYDVVQAEAHRLASLVEIAKAKALLLKAR